MDPGTTGRQARGVGPLAVLSAIVVLVVLGQARGVWLPNLHNGLLAVAFGVVGTYLEFHRPASRLGRLYLATGAVESVLFCGRQIGHSDATSVVARWWAWLGVWPVAIALALTTLAVICFPNGRLPSPRWRVVAGLVVGLSAVCAGLSAVWPVEYASAGLMNVHPVRPTAPGSIDALWSAIAHPAYVAFQVLWVVAVVVRWRRSSGIVRVQLACLAGAAAISVGALMVGLVIAASPRAGILSAAIVPIAAGWAVVHGRHLATYTALSWLSRAPSSVDELPTGLARAATDALDASGATLWVGADELMAIGVWPESEGAPTRTTHSTLRARPDRHVQRVLCGDDVIGALSIDRAQDDPLSSHERRLLDDLASHARLVIEHLGLADLVTGAGPTSARMMPASLSPREQEVLELMARGLSNAAICEELHLSVKTVEPVVSSIFTKLGLHSDSATNRRVLAVLVYLRA